MRGIDLSWKIKINDHYEISFGRFLITLMIVVVQSISIGILTGNWAAIFPLWTTFLLSLDKKKD